MRFSKTHGTTPLSCEHLRFLLYQVHDIESILSLEYFADYDRSSIDILIDSVKNYSDKELFPYFKEMDDKGAYFEDGKVHVHPQIGKIM
ncbi:acyl-CoA dehydrogenase N-terminal domain-containing protein, partial [Saprospiraceae bacterium]|nr:acyl-CoA dehydrogenase N-terminal domain-containing protein [Saprospiraceae bacterium]